MLHRLQRNKTRFYVLNPGLLDIGTENWSFSILFGKYHHQRTVSLYSIVVTIGYFTEDQTYCSAFMIKFCLYIWFICYLELLAKRREESSRPKPDKQSSKPIGRYKKSSTRKQHTAPNFSFNSGLKEIYKSISTLSPRFKCILVLCHF